MDGLNPLALAVGYSSSSDRLACHPEPCPPCALDVANHVLRGRPTECRRSIAQCANPRHGYINANTSLPTPRSDDEDKSAAQAVNKQERSRPGFGRAYFAAGEADAATSAAGGDGKSSANPDQPESGKKRALPKAADMMSATGPPAFIAHTVAAAQERNLRLPHVPLEERPVQEVQKTKGLLEVYEERKRQHKAISARYHVPDSELDDHVDPVRSRPKRPKETGDIGWLEVFARRSKEGGHWAGARPGKQRSAP